MYLDTWWRNQSTASACSTTDAFGPICIKEVQELAALAGRGMGKNPFTLAISDDTTFANAMYYMPTLANQRMVMEAGSGGTATLTRDLKTFEPTIYIRGAKLIFDHAATSDTMRFFKPGESIVCNFAKNNFFRVTPRQTSENTFSWRILVGCVLQLVNKNPFSTGVLYNFNA